MNRLSHIQRVRLPNRVLFVLALFLTIGCQKPGGMQSQLGVDNPNNPFTDSFGGDFESNVLGGGDAGLGGSGNSGNLTQTDKTALTNLFDEYGDVNPQEETDIPDGLEAQLKEIISRERKGHDMTPLKIQLAGQVLAKCTSDIALYAPQPGESLQGAWGGTCARTDRYKYSTKINFTVTGVFAKTFQKASNSTADTQNRGFAGAIGLGPARYSVSGNNGIKGYMTPNGSGAGRVQAGAWKGNLFDRIPNAPASIMARLKGNTRQQCSGNVAQSTWTNKTPEKYAEAMKKAGQCYRKALVLFSPVMDELFSQMEPQIAYLLLTRMLGIKSGRR